MTTDERSDATALDRLDTLIARLRYWQGKKLALDAARPEFTADQLRELNAAESRLLACDPDELEAALAASRERPTPEGLCTKCSATQYCAEHDPSLSVAREIVKFLRSNEIDGGANLTRDEAAERIELWFLRDLQAAVPPVPVEGLDR